MICHHLLCLILKLSDMIMQLIFEAPFKLGFLIQNTNSDASAFI